jgi:general secretion pathway protein A
MYKSFFGLSEKPFAITPDPRYLYLSERHAEALAHLAYGITEAGGFIQLTGEVGTGKTTVLRSLLQQLPPQCDVALILNPRVTPAEFLLCICDELHLQVPAAAVGSVKSLVDLLTHFLLDAHGRGRRVVLMVDEAQNLSPDVLEQVRLLTNLETATQKLLQIILIGQPELRAVLSRPELRQLAQRVTGRYHLEALRRPETIAYIRHRLRVAGATSELLTPGALRETHRLAGGVPRIINVIADRALLGAYTREEHRATAELVRRAATEVYGRPVLAPWVRWAALAGSAAGIALLAFVFWRAAPVKEAVTASAPPPTVVQVTPAPMPVMPPPAPRPELGALIALDADATTIDSAFDSLFRLWGATYQPGGGRGCEQALAFGLSCVWQRGSIAQLKLINRPAILSLVDADGALRQVVLAALDGDRAQLLVGASAVDATIADLADYWFGEFIVLWRPQAALRPACRNAR